MFRYILEMNCYVKEYIYILHFDSYCQIIVLYQFILTSAIDENAYFPHQFWMLSSFLYQLLNTELKMKNIILRKLLLI